MMSSSSRIVALTNLQWKIAHGIIGLRILKDRGQETPFLNDMETACNVAANGKGLNELLPSVLLTRENADKISAMLLETKNLVENCRKSKEEKSIETALTVAENMYDYIEGLASRPPVLQAMACLG